MMTDELMSPEKASDLSRTPVTNKMPMTPQKTTSVLSRVNKSAAINATSVAMVIHESIPKPKIINGIDLV